MLKKRLLQLQSRSRLPKSMKSKSLRKKSQLNLKSQCLKKIRLKILPRNKLLMTKKRLLQLQSKRRLPKCAATKGEVPLTY